MNGFPWPLLDEALSLRHQKIPSQGAFCPRPLICLARMRRSSVWPSARLCTDRPLSQRDGLSPRLPQRYNFVLIVLQCVNAFEKGFRTNLDPISDV